MRNSQTSTSKIPPHVVAWLSAEGWTAEELSFLEDNTEIFTDGDYDNALLLRVRRYMKIYKRTEAQKGERAREYDSKNNYQGKDSPSWFGEGTDRDLFK